MEFFRKRNVKWKYHIYSYDEVGRRREQSQSNYGSKREVQMAAAKEETKLLNNTFVMDQNIRFDTLALE